jgi:hypothetical protein
MRFNSHSEYEGRHAFLSPSNYHWIDYSDDKLVDRFTSAMAAVKGTRLHDFARDAINLGIKLPRTPTTINMYVNDGIGYKMSTEQTLFYSANCFGTADTICFRRNMLRIHDLKTGKTPTSSTQLEVYAALFCLEYGIKPLDIEMEFRIYQSDEARIYPGDPVQILRIMSRIKIADQQINNLRLEADE